MKREEWARIEAICVQAMEMPVEARGAFLDEACAGSGALRAEVDSLLAQIDTGPAFFDEPIVRLAESDTGDTPSAAPTRIGPYRIVRPLGSGGMGEVLLAVQEGDGFERHVALKLVREGMDTDRLLQRFDTERRILAGLDHPGIARLLDAGRSESGRPFIVMEFVDGVRIDDWCERESASVDERLRLLTEVCSAVQHAHQNLVLHRDLKPSNIMVTTDGSAKLLDFGVGKILDAEADGATDAHTRAETRMLTPEYASPELLDGQVVTTAADIYSLGVVAYELLSGCHPFTGTGRTRQEIEKLVRESRPVRPSERVLATAGDATTTRGEWPPDSRRLQRHLRGDLDNIVLKALRREPGRRYTSAAGLAEDIERHLAGRPVLARPDTLGYRVGKFVRRNRVSVAAAGVVAVAVVSAAAWTGIQNQRVRAEAQRVTAERDKALAVQGFLMETFGAVGPSPSEGDEVAARALLDAQARSLTGYADRPALLAEMNHVLADGYERLGFADEAAPYARAALEWRAAELSPSSVDLARTTALLGWIERQRGDGEEAERLLRASVEAMRPVGESGADVLGRALNDLGVVLGDGARLEDAESALREALSIREGEEGRQGRGFGVTANNLAANLAQQGRMTEAAEYMDASATALEARLGPDHARVWSAQSNRAVLRMYGGYTEALVEELRDVLAGARRIFGDEHPSTSRAMTQLAIAIRDTPFSAESGRTERLAESEALLREALASRERRLGPTHPELIDNVTQLGVTLRSADDLEEAIAVIRRGLELSQLNYGDAHPRTAVAWSRLGDALIDAGEVEASDEAHVEALGILRASLGDEHRETATQMLKVGRRHVQRGMHDEGIALLSLAERSTRQALPEKHRSRLMARTMLADAYLTVGDSVTADSIARAARADWDMDDSVDSDRLRTLEARLGG